MNVFIRFYYFLGRIYTIARTTPPPVKITDEDRARAAYAAFMRGVK